MHRTRRTTRLASALALVAVFLRVVLPLLHTHDHHHLPGSQAGAAVEVCSCGAVHAKPGGSGAERESVDAAPDEHHCLACEVEEGTPFGCPPDAEAESIAPLFAAFEPASDVEVLVASQVRLGQPRAPPVQQV